ncbi:MAG: NusG domain II-containing protein [Clostridia bacterium]|nr:NusG domain II-containing protein [Clostridia bacterium]
MPDGTQTLNLIHLTPDSVYMEDSTCENHDCIGQGIVSFENKEERILGNMIVCLPNQVLLELYTAEEVAELVAMGMPAPQSKVE